MSEAHHLYQGFAAEVRAELARQGRTPYWLSENTDITYQTLARRLRGSSRFSLTEVAQIASALNLSVTELMIRAERTSLAAA